MALVLGGGLAPAGAAESHGVVVGVVTEVGGESLTIFSERTGAVTGILDPGATRVTRSGAPAGPRAIRVADRARARIDMDGQWIRVDLAR